jgi:hypothetical protein
MNGNFRQVFTWRIFFDTKYQEALHKKHLKETETSGV